MKTFHFLETVCHSNLFLGNNVTGTKFTPFRASMSSINYVVIRSTVSFRCLVTFSQRLLSFADNLCKQLVNKSRQTKHGP